MRVATRDRSALGRYLPWTAALVLAGVTGCSNIAPVEPADAPISDPMQLYRTLMINHPAATLSTVAPYDTMQLVATARNALGTPMSGVPVPTFRLQDPSDSVRLLLAPDGKVRAVGTTTGTGVRVIASLTVGPVTHVDTARIVVTNVSNPPRLASLSIDPIPPDSAIWSVDGISSVAISLILFTNGGNSPLPEPRLMDSAGNTVSTTSITYASSSLDPDVATFERWSTSDRSIKVPGQVRRVVQTYAYGIALADTVKYTVTLPIGTSIEYPRDASSEPRIAPNGFILWWIWDESVPDALRTNDTTDIVFDDPAAAVMPDAAICEVLVFLSATQPCVGGNGLIVDNLADGMGSLPYGLYGSVIIRKFPKPGVYPYHSTRHPERRGRIIVADDPYARY